MSSQWQRRGEGVVNAGVDFVSGVGRAFGNLGNRIQRGRYAAFIDAFCAVAGDVASQNGRFLPAETEGLKRFLLHQQESPVFRAYGVDEVQEKLKTFAVAAFLGEEEQVVRALRAIEPGSDEARMIILAALAIAFADGECDDREAASIAGYARRLAVDVDELAQGFGLTLPAGHGAAATLLSAPLSAPLSTLRSNPESTELLPDPQFRLESSRSVEAQPQHELQHQLGSGAPTAVARQPLCRRCWSFLVAGNPRCDCGRDLRNDIAVR